MYKKLYVFFRLLTARNIVRPQINFKVPVDNTNLAPFEPSIKSKPNSLKPLAILPEYDEDGNIDSFLHPYEFELDKFEPNDIYLAKVTPIEPLKLENTPLIHVVNEIELKELLSDLKEVKEFSMDLEHHSYRTFQVNCCNKLLVCIFNTLLPRE